MSDPRQLDRADRIGMYMSIALVAIGAVIAIAAAVRRLIEIGDGTDVPVTVPLADEAASLPLGPDGTPVSVTVDTATVTVADPAPATLFALNAQPIWTALVVCAGLAIAALFFARLARGAAFTTGAARLAIGASALIAVGWVGATILTNMTTNGAFAALSERSYDSVRFEVSLVPVVAVLVTAAVGAALQIGERLQRDTEGLV